MNERLVRRLTSWTAALVTCLVCVIAVPAAVAADTDGKWSIASRDQGATFVEDVVDQPVSIHTLQLTPAVEAASAAPALVPNPSWTPDATAPDAIQTQCAQILTALPNNNFFSQQPRCPLATFRFERGVYLITAADMAAAGFTSGAVMTGIGFTYNNAPGVAATAPLKFYLENTADATNLKSTTWATAIGTMTLVHDDPTTLPNAAVAFDIPFVNGSPFTYTGGGVYVGFDWGQYTGTLAVPGAGVPPVGILVNTTLPASNFHAQSNLAAPTTLTVASASRPETRFLANVDVPDDDVAVTQLRSYGAVPKDLSGVQIVQALVANLGAVPKTNFPVTLTIAGANNQVLVQNVASMAACGGSATVTFNFPAGNLGSETLTASVPIDGIPANNSITKPLDITTNQYSFKHPGTIADGGVGLTAPGAFVGKFTVTHQTTVSAVTLEFPAAGTQTYRVAIYAASGAQTPGLQLYLDAADRTVPVAGPVTITLPVPITVGPGNFFAGIQQTSATNAGLSYDNEDPLRTTKLYAATALPVVSWIDLGPLNPFKLNVGVVIDPCANFGAACDDGNQCTNDSCSPTSGCTYTVNTCDDFDACTVDTCDPEFGCFNEPIDCNDSNPCTDDSCISQALLANPCTVADDGSGTVTLPPAGCTYLSPSDVHEIVNGLPPGTTIRLGAAHRDFICGGAVGTPPQGCDFVPNPECERPGGNLGGQEECADSSVQLTLEGTGALAGFNRTLNLPLGFQTHVGPKSPGQPFQTFDTDMFRMQGQLFPGDPDFDLLRIRAGTAFGMPSPGHTTLRQAVPGGPWTVDSFFDIFYEIEFIGAPGGPLAGMTGITRDTIRMSTGDGVGCVNLPTDCNDDNPCTIDACNPMTGCTNLPINCDDNQVCTVDSCDPSTGECVHTPDTCDDGNACTVDSCAHALVSPQCAVTDNGGGTVTLPPAGCEYLSPSDVHEIINGLPPGTTIEFAAIHKDFICHEQQGTQTVCSFSPPPGLCTEPGGSLGGEKECAQSNLAMQLHGTGDLAGFDRTIQVPLSFETHVGPRTPGAPTQSFDSQMFRAFGQITGDPDFDLLRVVAGNDFGLPSPGHTTLRQLPGNQWAVDSFFDITYRIDFVGAPGGPLAGMSGSTTATIRMQVGSGVGCSHTPIDCDDSNVCTDDSCNPGTGQCVYSATNCDDSDACTVDSCVQGFAANPCEVAPTGGTVVLPPAGCAYLSPQDVHRIQNGLPPGTQIQLGAIHRDFICRQPGGGGAACSFSSVTCTDGTPATGEKECAESTLTLNMHGVGIPIPDRTIGMPISFETRVQPRTPGSPVQSFATEMFRLQGQITGDPDFDLLRITGGAHFGMPSPGHTTLTLQGNGNYKVDSFFDITYRIDFIGAPGGPLGGMSGSTTGTIRMATGTGVGCVHIPGTAPLEISPVTASKSGGNIIVIWPGSASTYDVVRGDLAALPVGPGAGDEQCLSNDGASTSLNDGFIPAQGAGAWYLVRGNNACGAGSYGNRAQNGVPGAPRVTTTCP